MGRVSSGAEAVDEILMGGYDDDCITTIYGPSGSGKTNLVLICTVEVAKAGKKVLFIDTEGGIAVERIRQLGGSDILENIVFFRPITFEDQKRVFEELKGAITERVGLVVVDSISMLYRLELGRSEEVYEVNSSLGRQMAQLVEIARTRKIPVLLTNQVYSDFGNRDAVKMVGGDLLKYGSKCLIELVRFEGARGLILRKHRCLPEGKQVVFKIIGEGIEKVGD